MLQADMPLQAVRSFLRRLNGLKATLSIPATPSAAQAAPTLGAAKSRLRTTVSASVLPKAPSRIATESGSGANTPRGCPGGRKASAVQTLPFIQFGHHCTLHKTGAVHSVTPLLHGHNISGVRETGTEEVEMSEPSKWMNAGPQRSEGSRLKHPLMMQTLIRKLTTELELETRHDQARDTTSSIGFALALRYFTTIVLRQARLVLPAQSCRHFRLHAKCRQKWRCVNMHWTIMQTMSTSLSGAADQIQGTAEAQLEDTSC